MNDLRAGSDRIMQCSIVFPGY